MTILSRPISLSSLTYGKILFLLFALVLFPSRSCLAQISGKTAVLPSKEEVLDAIGRKELAHDPHLHLQIKPWDARPGSFVAMVYITASVSDDLDEGDGVEIVRAVRLQPTLALLESVDRKSVV